MNKSNFLFSFSPFEFKHTSATKTVHKWGHAAFCGVLCCINPNHQASQLSTSEEIHTVRSNRLSHLNNSSAGCKLQRKDKVMEGTRFVNVFFCINTTSKPSMLNIKIMQSSFNHGNMHSLSKFILGVNFQRTYIVYFYDLQVSFYVCYAP